MGRITNYMRILLVVAVFSVAAAACGGSSGNGNTST
jgi:hypothetical protein